MVTTGKLTVAVWPGTTACGTITCKAGLLLEMEIEITEPTGAGWTRVAVQLVAELGERVVLEHLREESATEVDRLRVVEREEPLKDADRMALWAVENVPALMGKEKVAAPAGIVTDAGIWRVGLLVESATAAPPAGAEPERESVHVVAALGASVDKPHCREESNAEKVRETLALLEEPFRDAVTIAI